MVRKSCFVAKFGISNLVLPPFAFFVPAYFPPTSSSGRMGYIVRRCVDLPRWEEREEKYFWELLCSASRWAMFIFLGFPTRERERDDRNAKSDIAERKQIVFPHLNASNDFFLPSLHVRGHLGTEVNIFLHTKLFHN